ncbi:amino acid/polyamine transporter I [Zopfochytrium polystomum]|nr:amino acid/polyamine transporter I [Zopfochytrium polystomum]
MADTNAGSSGHHIAPLAVGDQRLKRRIGWFEAGLFNVGMIIGTGIFTNPSLILSYAGSTGASLLLWILGVFVAAAGLWSFTELGTTLPRSGGEKEYLAYAYPKPSFLLSYLFALNGLIILRGAGLANGLIVFGNYVNYAIYGPTYLSDYGSRLWAFGALSVLAIINIVSVPIAVRLNSVVTVYKMALVTFIIITGIVALAGGFKGANIPGLTSSNINFDGTSTDTGSFATAIYYVMFVYNGWANVNYILDEVQDPVRNLPKAAIFSLSSTFVLYILANLSYFSVLTKSEILGSNLTVAANFFTKTYGGTFGSRVLPILVALSPFGFGSSILYTGSRVILETAREGLLPFADYFGWVEPRTKSPIFAILLLWVLGVVFLFAPPPGQVFSFIVTYAGYTGYLFYLFAVVGIYIIRNREPELHRPIKVPLVAAGFFCLFALYELIFSLVPPKKSSTTYPYYAPYVLSIAVLILTIGLWYLQVIWYKGPEKSYNSRIAAEGVAELKRDVYGNDAGDVLNGKDENLNGKGENEARAA